MAKFSDCFNTSGPFRVLFQNEAFFVAGHGMLIPATSYPDGMAKVEQLDRYRAEEFHPQTQE